MNMTFFYTAIAVGTLLSLFAEEFTGISCGGLIVPAYLAMVCDDPATVVLVILISLVTYAIVQYGLRRVMILYGRRLYAANILTALLLIVAARLVYPVSILSYSGIVISGVGAVTPGLLARTYANQGIRYTLPACLIVTVLTYAISAVITLM